MNISHKVQVNHAIINVSKEAKITGKAQGRMLESFSDGKATGALKLGVVVVLMSLMSLIATLGG